VFKLAVAGFRKQKWKLVGGAEGKYFESKWLKSDNSTDAISVETAASSNNHLRKLQRR
jgi:hypothetical protein